MKSLEECVINTLHQEDFGHGTNCYCEEFEDIFKRNKDLHKLLHDSPFLNEILFLQIVATPIKGLMMLSIIMMEVGIRIGLQMATPEIDKNILNK